MAPENWGQAADEWPSSPDNDEHKGFEVQEDEYQDMLSNPNDLREYEEQQRESSATTWGKLQTFGRGPANASDNQQPPSPEQEVSIVREVFGDDIADDIESSSAAEVVNGADAIVELLGAAAALASGQVMFAPSLGLDPVPQETVAYASFELVKSLLASSQPEVCDAATRILKTIFALLRAHSDALELREAMEEVVRSALLAGPCSQHDSQWNSRMWQILDIAIQAPSIGVHAAIDMFCCGIADKATPRTTGGCVTVFVLDFLMHAIRRYHIQPSGAVPLEASVKYALRLLQTRSSAEIVGKAFDLVVEIHRLVNKRLEPMLRNVKPALHERLTQAFAALDEEAKCNNRRRRSVSSAGGRSSRRGSVSSAAHFIETGIRAEPQIVMQKMGPDMFIRATGKRQGRDESDGDFLARLTHLVLKNKGINQIEGLESCRKVQVLYLYDNLIPRIENLAVLSKTLSHLYLQNNHIQNMSGLECLPRLTKLYLEGNEIQRIECLQHCQGLEELHISNQRLPPGLSLTFDENSLMALGRSLMVLTAANNNIVEPHELCILQNLGHLDISGNHIASLACVLGVTSNCPYLMKLDVAGNLFMKQPKVRETIITHSSDNLEELDGKEVTSKERHFLRQLHGRQRPARRASMPEMDHQHSQPNLPQLGGTNYSSHASKIPSMPRLRGAR